MRLDSYTPSHQQHRGHGAQGSKRLITLTGMPVTLEVLQRWLSAPSETERLEFKEAKQQYDSTKLLRYIVALSNEGGGHIVLGVSDRLPRHVVGSHAYENPSDLNQFKARVVEKLRLRVDAIELQHPAGRVLVFEVPSRPVGHPVDFEGAYLMRAGEDLVPMTADQLRRIFEEGQGDWITRAAMRSVRPEDVVALLDTQGYFDLLKQPYPTTRDGVLERLASEGLISREANGVWTISRLAALALAKRLDAFSDDVARKAVRVIIYDGQDKLNTRDDKVGQRGYAVGFQNLLDFVHSSATSEPICGAGGSRRGQDVPEASSSRTNRECPRPSGLRADRHVRDGGDVLGPRGDIQPRHSSDQCRAFH